MNGDRSILRTLEEQGKRAPRIRLDESERDTPSTGRYEVVGELARGGVGLVYRGRDNDLGRDVALKVLRDDLLKSPELIQRFIEEAQIGGQLQHPGIVPVYELGLRSDARPFFAMKLVKGDTLAARLANRSSPADDRRALLTAFRDVCRTMAYAHARGVIHRDLKPANIMIGNFGEVQVVDWGFAKVLRRGGVDDEGLKKRARDAVTLISTVRSDEGSADSVAGSVMGTPSYMPPEQAMGKVEELDEKSDIFSLGAILLEMLTGSAPYVDEDGRQRIRDAAKARLDPALARLDGCDAEEELVALCRRCLEPLPKDRPASAEALADQVAACLARAERRAHEAKVRAFRAETKAEEQKRARRFTTLVGSSVVAALLIATAAFLWVDAGRAQRAQERRSAIDAALEEASRHQAAKEWPAALAAVGRATDLGHRGPLADTIRLQAAEAARIAERHGQEEMLLDDLERARAMRGDHYDDEAVDAAYASAIERLWPDGRVDTGRLAASEKADAFAAAFDAWAYLRRDSLEEKDWRGIDAWARAIDPASNLLRDAVAAEDEAGLVALLRDTDLSSIPVARLAVLGTELADAGRREAALDFLLRAYRLHPDDFWINLKLSWLASWLEDDALSLRHSTAALAIRPESLEARHQYGIALEASGDIEGALEVWKDAFESQPDWSHGLRHIAEACAKLGRDEAAEAAYEKGAELDTKEYSHYLSWGLFLRARGRAEAAVAAFERAVELGPEIGTLHNWLGHAYDTAGRPSEAEESFRAAIDPLADDRPNLAANYASLSDLLRREGQLQEAFELGKKAFELLPESGQVLNNLGLVYAERGEYEKAIETYERALDADTDGATDRALVLVNLSDSLLDRATSSGTADAAVLARVVSLLRSAVDVDPDSAYAHLRLGSALAHRGQFRQAIAELERAGGLSSPGTWMRAQARGLLGEILVGRMRFGEAVPHLQEVIRIDPDAARPRFLLSRACEAIGEEDAAVEAMRAAARVRPDYLLELGMLLDRLGRYRESIGEYRRALASGQAAPEDLPALHYHLGTALFRVGDLEHARIELETATDLRPTHPESWCNLGWCLREVGRWPEALSKLRKGHELGLARGNWSHPSKEWVARTGRMVELMPRLAKLLEGGEVDADPEDRANLAEMLRVKGRIPLSVRLYREAFRADPSLGALGGHHLYMAIRAAVEGDAEQKSQALVWARRYVGQVARLLPANPKRVWEETSTLRLNPELAPVRDRADLPADWKKLWSQVARLRNQARSALQGGGRPANHPYAGFNASSALPGRPLAVESVQEGTPAAAAGLRPGDVIERVGEYEIRDLPSYREAMEHCRPGDEVAFVVTRDGERLMLRVTLGRYGDYRKR